MTDDSLWAALRDAGADIDQCLDALWLARVLPTRTTPRRRERGGTGAEPASTSADPGPAVQPAPEPGPGPLDEPSGPATAGRPRRRRAAGLYASATADGADGIRATPADVPAPRAIPRATELARALKPLRRTVPSVARRRLDEAATVEAVAETGLISAVLRPEREPWLDLTLVVDTGSSMVIWNRMVVELRELLHRLRAFRRIKVVGLDTDETRMALRTRPFAAGSRVAPDVEGNGLTLVLTDGIGPAWHSGAAQRLLARRARAGPMAVLHTLPARLWEGTGIACARLDVWAPGPAVPNRLLGVRHPFLPAGTSPGGAPGDIPVPVLEFPNVSPRSWADLVAHATTAESLPVTMFGAGPSRTPGLPAPLGRSAAPAERIREFHASASYEAFRLAAHFAAVAPLPLPVMRLVQHATTADATPTHLAEVFASGLLTVHRPGRHGPEHTEYTFEQEVGDLLLDTLSVVEGLRTVEAVTRYLGRRADRTPSVSVLLAEDGATHRVGADARPFAMADAPLVRRLRNARGAARSAEVAGETETGARPFLTLPATTRVEPAVARRAVYTGLRRLREERGLTQRDVGATMDWSLSKVIRIETGQVSVSITDLRALLRLYDVRDRGRVDAFVANARASRRRSWWFGYSDPVVGELGTTLPFESAATGIRGFEPHLIPDVLQTEEYTREVLLATLPVPAAHFREALDFRLERQQRLLRENGPEMRFVLDESVVRRMVGGPAVMRRQMERLREYARHPRITVRIMPFSAGLCRGGHVAFQLLSVPGPNEDVVLAIERPGSGVIVCHEGQDDPPSSQPMAHEEIFRTLEDRAHLFSAQVPSEAVGHGWAPVPES